MADLVPEQVKPAPDPAAEQQAILEAFRQVAAEPTLDSLPTEILEDEPAADIAPTAEVQVGVDLATRLDEMGLRLDESELRRQKLEAQLEHEKLIRDQQNTKAGYYKKVALDLARSGRPQAETTPQDEDFPQAAQFRREIDSLRNDSESLRTDAVQRASQEALSRFFMKHEDVGELSTEMLPFVSQAKTEYAQFLNSGDPDLVRRTSELILHSAYLDAKAKRLSETRAQAETKRAQMLEANLAGKKAAVISGTGGASAPVPRPKTIKEMSPTDIQAALLKVDWGR